MNKSFVFDVDGTLTPSRGVMDKEFKEFFLDFQSKENVYLVTGSDRDKTLEQVGEDIYNECRMVFNCSGNSMWVKDRNVYNNEWELAEAPWKYLESMLIRSSFIPKTGWHFDVRLGLVNFSILGRKATPEQRKAYIDYDTLNNEREYIANELNEYFGEKYNVHATVGGETGIDISGIGMDKSQILKHFEESPIEFFGDRMEVGGNDHSLASAIINRHLDGDWCYHVSGWEETWDILKNK